MKKIMNYIAIALLLLILIGCTTTPTGFVVKEPETVKIGGLFGLTGFAAFAGQSSRDGFILAIEDSDIPIEYVIEDFESDITTTVTTAMKLVHQDKVTVVIGPEWVEFSEAVSPIAAETKTLFISPWNGLELEWAKNPYYMAGSASERDMNVKLVDHMKSQNIKNLAIINHNNAYAYAVMDFFKKVLAERSDINIVTEISTDETVMDYRTEITKLKQKDFDALYVVFARDDSQGAFNKQLKQLGVKKQVYLTFSRGENDQIQDTFADVSQGMLYPAPKKYKRTDEWHEKYTARFGQKPAAISAATTYDMTTLVIEAIKQGATTSNEIKDYLMQIDGYEGYSNTISFNEYGQVASEEVVIKMVNGKNPIILVD